MEKINDFSLPATIVIPGVSNKEYSKKAEDNKGFRIFDQKLFVNFQLKDILYISFQFYPSEIPRRKSRILFRFCDEYEALITLEMKQRHLYLKVNSHIGIFDDKVMFMDWNKITIICNQNTKEVIIHINNFQQTLSIEQLKFPKLTKCFLIFGCKEPKESFLGLVKEFSIKSMDLNEAFSESLQAIQQEHAKWKITHHFDEPLSNPLYDLRELDLWKPYGDKHCKAFIPLDKSHSRKKGKPKVCICHDMMGGYTEDHWPFGFKGTNHAYRFYHWNFTDIFIYFSHQRVTIPPPNYINLSHSFGTKCLGVLITEWEDGEKENKLLIKGDVKLEDGTIINKGKYYYADKLVEICSYYGFDGYLINFESKFENAKEAADWLAYFTKKIHEVVPGSIIMHYDSVISNGEVRWQSQLNDLNRMFFEATDLFFTDYHWNEDKIRNSAKNAGKRINDLYTGIDFYGRGCYAGGQFNSYLAVDKCLENNTSIAFFAPAWTYENFGSYEDKLKFMQIDQRLWYGTEFVELGNSRSSLGNKNNIWQNMPSNSDGWKTYEENGVVISVASFGICVRFLLIDLADFQTPILKSNGTITFMASVIGTPPKSDDFYNFIIEGLSPDGKVMFYKDTKNNVLKTSDVGFIEQFTPDNLKRSTSNWETIALEVELSELSEIIKTKVKFIKVIEIGKDVEYWAGHYGPKFKGEVVFASMRDTKKSLLHRVQPRRIKKLPIHTFFDEGQGHAQYIEGLKATNEENFCYNNLNDFDINLSYFNMIKKKSKHFANQDYTHPTNMSIINTESWNGTSCALLKGKVNSGQCHPYKFYRLKIKQIINNTFICLVVHKGKSPNLEIAIELVTDNDIRYKMEKTKSKLTNNWTLDRYEFTLPKDLKEIPKYFKSLYFVVNNTSVDLVNYEIMLGEISFYDDLNWRIKANNMDLNSIPDYLSNLQVSTFSLKNYELGRKRNVIYANVELELGKLLKDAAKLIKNIRIFKNDQWVMNSKSQHIFIENLEVSVDSEKPPDELKIQIIMCNGNRSLLKNIKPIRLDHKNLTFTA